MNPFTGVGVGLGGPTWNKWPPSIPALCLSGRSPRKMSLGRAAAGIAVMKNPGTRSVITHGLSMSMGGFDAWDRDVLDNLKGFLKETRSPGIPNTFAGPVSAGPPPWCCPCHSREMR